MHSPKRTSIVRLASLTAALFTSVIAAASDFHSPRTAALGGAGHAGPLLNDSIYLNPAFASFLPTYSISGNWGFFRSPDNAAGTHDLSGRILNASLQDGRTEIFQAGVSYTVREDAKLIHVGASKALAKKVGLGLGGKYVIPKRQGDSRFEDLTFATNLVAADWFFTVVTVDNLIASDEARKQGFYREYTLGTKFNIQGLLMLYFDPHLAQNLPNMPSYGYEAGAELPLMTDLYARAGMFRNSNIPSLRTRGNGFGFGFGWLAPRISFDFAIERTLEPTLTTTQTVGTTIYF